TNICDAFQTSVVFKSLYLGWHMPSYTKKLDKTLFLFIERDSIENAASLLQIRKKYFGDINKWASIKPLEYDKLKEKDAYTQVMGQVKYLNNSYKKQLDSIPEKNKLLLSYDALCHNPEAVLEKVIAKLQNFGLQHSMVSPPPCSFDKRLIKKNDEFKRLETAFINFEKNN
ncbi:MAG TPA: hypothetical protein VFM72_09045, partial [Aequorivita sp.]|nr:hypothetical protein [Aequorivita sp.]